jgi:hypothetical protein
MVAPHPLQSCRVHTNRRRRGAVAGWACAVAFAVLAAVAAAGSAAEVDVAVRHRGDRIAIEASATLDAAVATAWRVLTDYGRYPEFVPDLAVSRVVARDGSTVIVQQSGDALVWLLRVPLEVTYEITEFPPRHLRSRAVAGSLRLLESDYRLTAVPAGVRLDYTGYAATRTGLFGPFERWVIEDNATRQLRALAEAIERAARDSAIPAPTGPGRGGR